MISLRYLPPSPRAPSSSRSSALKSIAAASALLNLPTTINRLCFRWCAGMASAASWPWGEGVYCIVQLRFELLKFELNICRCSAHCPIVLFIILSKLRMSPVRRHKGCRRKTIHHQLLPLYLTYPSSIIPASHHWIPYSHDRSDKRKYLHRREPPSLITFHNRLGESGQKWGVGLRCTSAALALPILYHR